MIPNVTGWFTDHLGVKLLALLLALAVYAHVYTQQEQEWSFRVPLQVTGLPDNLVLTGHPPDMVEVEARGKGKDRLKLKVQNARMIVDLSEVRPGHVQRMLSPADVALPVGTEVEITEVRQPRMVSLTVDTLITRDVDVRLSLLGDLPEHYVLDGVIRPDPPRVRLTGPAAELNGLTSVNTEPLRLDDLRGAGGFELGLVTDTLDVVAEPPVVHVEVPLVRLVPRTLPPMPVQVTNLARGYDAVVEPDSAEVVVRGPAGVVDSLRAEEVRVILDASDLAPGRHLLSPDVVLAAPRIRLLNVRPARYLVEIQRRHR